MPILAYLLLLMAGGTVIAATEPDLEKYQQSQPHMGTLFKVVLYAPDERTANDAFQAAFQRIGQLDKRLSDYDPDSELNRLCRSAPHAEPVKVSDDLWSVLQAADQLSRQTEGAFDVTVGPYSRLWRRARRLHQLPSDQRLAAAREVVGHKLVQLDCETQRVRLLKADMQLDLGGIAKGYAADQALAAMRDAGVSRALVNAGGDLAIGDAPPDEAGWTIGIAPLEPQAPPSRFLQLTNCGVATSGDAWQHVEIDGTRYSHIINPHTGIGLTHRSGVTVVAPDGMTADALASALSVLPPREGLPLLRHYPGAAALILQLQDGQLKTHETGIEALEDR